MAVTVTRYYDGTYHDTYSGTTVVLGTNTSGVWALPIAETHNGSTFYRINSNLLAYGFYSTDYTRNQNGASTVAVGQSLYWLDQNFSTLYDYKTSRARGNVTADILDSATGSRIIYVKAVNGSVLTPSLGAGSTIAAVTRPDGNQNAVAGILAVTAGEGVPFSGTLLDQGKTAGVWKNWTWNKAVLTSAQQTGEGVSTTKSITMSLLAGLGDDTLKANFETTDNPADTWKPGKGNGTVVVHILDDNLNEVANSNTTSLAWSTFKASYMTGLTAAAGGNTAAWFNTTPVSAYLLNVNSATFTVVPKSPYKVYKWRLERPGGTDEQVFGQTASTFSSFASGNVVHLYLTTASAAPRIRYDGFDGEQPGNTAVVDSTSAAQPVGHVWTSPSNAAFTLQLAPAAWSGATLGITKSVIVNGGSSTALPAAAKSYTFTSSAEPYSVTTVKFKQVQAATNGELTLSVVKDTNTSDVSVSVTVTQQGTQLGTALSASGARGYYVGEGDLNVVAVPSYANGAAPSNYSITLSVAAATELDAVNGLSATLDASGNARTVTVTVTRITYLGALAGLAINVTRNVSDGRQMVTGTGNTLLASQGSLVVTFTEGQAAAQSIHVTCDAGTGYSLRRVIVTDDGVTPYVFVTVGAKTELDITLPVPVSKDGSNIKVILVVMANLVSTPVVNPKNVYDQGLFSALVRGAPDGVGGYYGDFRTGDLVTVEVEPVSVESVFMTGVLVGKIEFNGVELAATRTGDKLSVSVPLSVTANVFAVAMYAALETAYTAGTSPAPTVEVTWRTSDTITVSAVVYHRLGIGFTIAAEKVRGSSTAISATSALRSVADEFPYVTDSILPFEVSTAEPTIGSALFTLKGAQKVTVNYAAGVQYPTLSVAVYSYQQGDYITQGARPVIVVTPASGVTLGENTAGSWTPPGTNPGTDYTAAVFLVRQVTSTALFPVVTLSAASGGGRLEVWGGAAWLPRDTKQIALADATTFARWAVGTPPSGQVTVSIGTPQLTDSGGDMPAAVKVYVASAADGIDKTVFAPSAVKVSKNSAVGLSVTVPPGFVFIEWLIDAAVVKGISASVIVRADVTAVPVFAVATTADSVPMVLGGSETEHDEGIWVSKQFRAQWPWRPLVATVVKEGYEGGAQLAVGLGTGIELPDAMFADSPVTTQISIMDAAMRRLPAAAVQKSRFVRYGLKLLGGEAVMSAAVSTGASTLKGGH